MTGMLLESSENAVVTLGLPQRCTMDRIRRMTADHYGITVADIISKRRKRTISRPRQVAMYFCKKLTPRSYPEIGRFFGGRDHSTVIHAYRTVEDLLKRGGDFKKGVDTLWGEITDAKPLPTIEVEISEGETIEILAPPPPPPPKPRPEDNHITLDAIRREVADYYEIPLTDLTNPATTTDAHFYCGIVERFAYQVDLMHNLPLLERRAVDWDKQINSQGNRMVLDDMKVIWHRLMLLEQ